MKVPVNTALLVAILLLQLTAEPVRIEKTPIQIVPAVAEKIPEPPAVAEPVMAAAPAAPARAAVPARTISLQLPDAAEPQNDPVAYYKAKQRHLRAALMNKSR